VSEDLRHEEAVRWRSMVMPLLRDAADMLTNVAQVAPDSTEKRIAEEAAREARDLVRVCEKNLTVARRLVAREEKRQERAERKAARRS